MPRFRAKPVEIEAIQFTGDNAVSVGRWAASMMEKGEAGSVSARYVDGFAVEVMRLDTYYQGLLLWAGQWLIFEKRNTFTVAKVDRFHERYEPIAS